MSKVLFVCFQNAGKSILAEALFNARVNPAAAQAISAGIKPVPAPYPGVVTVLKELGLDVSSVKPQLLTPKVAASASLHIALGCKSLMPAPGPGQEATRDWDALPDAKNKTLEEFRVLRDAVSVEVEALLKEKGWAKQ